jgi:serine/threonine-protein kinase
LISPGGGKGAPVPVETDLLPPRYRDPTRIGQGGMGEIYRATDSTLGRLVAVKLLSDRYAQDEPVRGRFTREALAAARLSGEQSTVTIFDVGEWNGRPFIVMEYLGGGSLAERISASGAQTPADALRWLGQAASALDAAHAEGVVHRDVKPANLLLDAEDDVHVADFGVASAAGLDSLTATGTILGTAGYLSPEQAQGQRATPASDGYALGVVAFELLTGARPYARESATAEAAAHVHAEIPSARERNPRLPPAVEPVLARALAKDPGARYRSCSEFVSALRDALGAGGATTRALAPTAATVPLGRGRPPPPPSDRTGPPARRRRPLSPVAPVVLALVLLAGAAGAVIASVLTDGDGQGARERTFLKTVTGQGRTSVRTVTAEQPPSPPPVAPPAGAQSGAALNEEGFARMQAGDYAGALPLLEQAVAKLAGSGSLNEAYASYNLAFTRFQLERCDGVLDLLDRSESIQGHRDEIDELRGQAQERCG